MFKRDVHPFLHLAVDAARKAGAFLIKSQDSKKNIIHKPDTSFYNPATNIDVESEDIIVQHFMSVYPKHNFICEERGQIINDAACPYTWCIDPLDGTTNYRYGLFYYAVSIALFKNGIPELGVVYAPSLNHLFIGVKGFGATRNNVKIRVNEDNIYRGRLIFHYSPELHPTYKHLAEEQQCTFSCFNACSLDLCYVANGLASGGLLPVALFPWDFAAGYVILQEAGGFCCQLDGSELNFLAKNQLIFGNPDIVQSLQDILKVRQIKS